MNTQNITDLKETDIGPIPNDWNIKQLDELGTLTDGDWILAKYYSNTGVRLLQVGDIGLGAFHDKSERFISAVSADELKCTFIRSNNILISRMPDPIGRACIAPTLPYPAITAVDVSIMTPNEDVDHHFLMHVLNSSINLTQCTQLATGATRQRVSRRNLEKVLLPLPSLPEQRRIAAVLNAIQEAIAAQEDVIAAVRAFKRSLMQRLFIYGPSHEPAVTKETEIGEIPVHWKITYLKDVAVIGNGSTPKRTNPRYWTEGTIPWLTSTKIHDQFIVHADELVTPLAKQECHLPMVPRDSILVAITGQGKTLGNAALTTFETTINQHLAYITIQRQDVMPEFVLRYLQYQYEDLRQAGQAGGSTKAALTCGLLKLYPLPLPSLEEQLSIAEMVRVADDKIAAEEDRRAALQAFFKSMLYQLMTGQTRLLSDEGLPL